MSTVLSDVVIENTITLAGTDIVTVIDTQVTNTVYTGDVTSPSGSNVLTLATVNSNVGTFNNITVNGKGLVTAASNVAYITGNQTITITGDITGSGTTSISLTLATVNASVGTFGNANTVPIITSNAKGLITSVTTATITPTSIGLGNVSNNLQVINAGNGTSFASGTLAARPAAATNGRLYATTNNGIYLDNGTSWVLQQAAITGDISISANSTTATLATVNSNIGTFNNITINAKGLATAGSNANYLIDPAANGIVVRTALNTTTARTITGTTNQLNVTNGNGVSANPVLTIADNPIIPGTASITIPAGTTAQADTPSIGKIRFNSTLNSFTGARNGIYAPLGKIVQSINGDIAVQTGTSQSSYNNNTPAPTAGFEILNVTITPFFADSTVIISFPLMIDTSANNRTVVTTVYVNGTILVATTATNALTSGRPATQYLQGSTPSLGAGVPMTFAVRTGANGSGTVYINRGSTATMGNTGASTYTLIEEVA